MTQYHYISEFACAVDIKAPSYSASGKFPDELRVSAEGEANVITVGPGTILFDTDQQMAGLRHNRPFTILGINASYNAVDVDLVDAAGNNMMAQVKVNDKTIHQFNPPLNVQPGQKLLISARCILVVKEDVSVLR